MNNSPDDPLFADVDPNREFIRNAVRYLLAREHKDREASAILQEHFIKSEALTDDTLPDTLEKQLTFRDQAVGDKLEALKVVAEMFRFVRFTVYKDYTDRQPPNAKELVAHINKTMQALKVLYAPYVDEEWMRGMEEAIEMEAARDFPEEFDGLEPIPAADCPENEHQLH